MNGMELNVFAKQIISRFNNKQEEGSSYTHDVCSVICHKFIVVDTLPNNRGGVLFFILLLTSWREGLFTGYNIEQIN